MVKHTIQLVTNHLLFLNIHDIYKISPKMTNLQLIHVDKTTDLWVPYSDLNNSYKTNKFDKNSVA